MPLDSETALVPARRPFPTSALGFGVNGPSDPCADAQRCDQEQCPSASHRWAVPRLGHLAISDEHVRNGIGQIGVLKATGYLVP